MPQLTENQRQFRSAMATLPSPVSVVTTDGPRGRMGITVSAVCTVTDTPPTVLLCVNRSSFAHEIFAANERLCVNVLRADDDDLAMHFAGAGDTSLDERFGWDIWDHEALGVPVLRRSLVSLAGRIVGESSRGSHSVWFVEVDRIVRGADLPGQAASEDDFGAAASIEGLVYFRRKFHGTGVGRAPVRR